jgi:hypothetical protein
METCGSGGVAPYLHLIATSLFHGDMWEWRCSSTSAPHHYITIPWRHVGVEV